jgi:predicted molibdopterin-dependent oxidoreductase YjgC
VGALSSRINLKLEHHWWQRKTETTCTYCSVGCTIKLGSTRNQVYEVRTDDMLGQNDGITCVKGRFAMDFINSNSRLSKPMVRRDGKLVSATWDEALDLVAERLGRHRDAVGVVGSPKLTNEENYLLQKVARLGLGTNNIDYDGRADEAPALEVLRDMLGYPAPTNNFVDTRQKAGCVIAIGDSVYETHPVYAYHLQRLTRLTNKKVVVISPRWVKMCEWATLWLAPRPGTEEIVLHAMARVIADAGLQDDGYLTARTDGSAAYIQSLVADAFSLEEASSRTGVPAQDIVAAAYLYATGGTTTGPTKLPEPTHPSNLPSTSSNGTKEKAESAEKAVLGGEQVQRPEGGFPPSTIVFPASGTYTLTAGAVTALTNLALITGNIGRAGAGVNPLVSDANCLGANDMGCQPGYFPGYRAVNADNAREMESLWAVSEGNEVPGDAGLGLAGMIEAAAQGQLKAMWIAGANPVLSLGEPDSNRVRDALRDLDFLVVQDIFLNETAELADVVLPASSYAEKEGTYTNAERRVQRVRKAIAPLGVSKPDLTIIAEIGKRLGVNVSEEPRHVMEEIASVVPVYGGVSFARLDMTEFVEDAIPMPAAMSYKQLKVRSLMWPCPKRTGPGTPVLYKESFATPGGKAKLVAAVAPGAATEAPQAEGTLMATIGFPLFPFRTGTLSRHSYGLSRVEPDPRLHLNGSDAARLGIGDQEPVQVSFEGEDNSVPTYAVSLVYDRIPEGRAFLAITLEQGGTNPAVRAARHALSNGTGRKSVAIRVQPAAHLRQSREQLQPVATGNVLDVRTQPI